MCTFAVVIFFLLVLLCFISHSFPSPVFDLFWWKNTYQSRNHYISVALVSKGLLYVRDAVAKKRVIFVLLHNHIALLRVAYPIIVTKVDTIYFRMHLNEVSDNVVAERSCYHVNSKICSYKSFSNFKIYEDMNYGEKIDTFSSVKLLLYTYICAITFSILS